MTIPTTLIHLIMVNSNIVDRAKTSFKTLRKCRCPTCPRHFILIAPHPKYGACMFCFSPEVREVLGTWGEASKLEEIEQCDPKVIEMLSKISIVHSTPRKQRTKKIAQLVEEIW